MAFELSLKKWKLAFSNAEKIRTVTIDARYPNLDGFDWRRLAAPTQYTDVLTGDDRVLPLFRVTP